MIIRLINLALRMSCLVSKLIFVIILGKSLSVSEFGYYGLISSALIYFSGFIGLEFYTYSNRELLKNENSVRKTLTNQLMIFFISFSFVLFMISMLGVGEEIAGKYFLYFPFLLASEYVALEFGRLLNILNMQVISSILLFVRTALWMLPLSVYLYFNTLDSIFYLVLSLWLVMSIVSIICGYIVLKVKVGFNISLLHVNVSWIIKGIKNSFPLFISAQLTLLLFFLDKYFIKIFDNIEMVGIYSFYVGLINAMVSVLESSLFVFFIPKAIFLFQSGKIDELNKEIRKLSMISLSMIIGLIVIAMILIDYIIGFVGKDVYSDYKVVFFILLVSMLFRSLSQIYHYSIYAADKSRYILVTSILSLFIFLGFIMIGNVYTSMIYAVSISAMFVGIFQYISKLYIWAKLCRGN